VVLSITGPNSSLGEPERNTVKLFESQFSSIGGATVKWIVEDDASDATKAATAVKQLVERDNVAAVVCCTTSPNSMAIVKSAEDGKIPTISLAASASIVEPVAERKWVFKTPQNDSLMVDVLSDHMVKHGIKKVAFLGFNDAFGDSGLKEFQKVAKAKGIEITGAESFARTDTSVTAQLTRLANGKPDAYLVWAIPPGADVVAKDLANLGWKGPVYQSHGVANRTFIELGGPAVEGTYFPVGKLLIASDLPDTDPQKQTLLAYKKAYEDKYGANTANTFGGHAYDAMLILKGAIERALKAGADPNNLTTFRAALRDQIEATKELVGISGIFTYSASDHAGLDKRAAVMVQIKDGKWIYLKD
jgi:branched-chain amino acid transport system substrate-binding protein